jgi:hypothetical protein
MEMKSGGLRRSGVSRSHRLNLWAARATAARSAAKNPMNENGDGPAEPVPSRGRVGPPSPGSGARGAARETAAASSALEGASACAPSALEVGAISGIDGTCFGETVTTTEGMASRAVVAGAVTPCVEGADAMTGAGTTAARCDAGANPPPEVENVGAVAGAPAPEPPVFAIVVAAGAAICSTLLSTGAVVCSTTSTAGTTVSSAVRTTGADTA